MISLPAKALTRLSGGGESGRHCCQQHLSGGFIYQNMMIESNIIHAAHQNDGTNCCFSDRPVSTRNWQNSRGRKRVIAGHAGADQRALCHCKIAGIKLCESYNRQYGRDYPRSCRPTCMARMTTSTRVIRCDPSIAASLPRGDGTECAGRVVWGSGTPMREFLHVDDMAGQAFM